MRLDVYTVVFVRRPPNAPEFSDEELDRLQREHIAFNNRMRDEGHSLVSGPLRGQPDDSLRGINVFRTSVEETRKLMEDDASVRAGRLSFEVFTWLVPAGTLGDRPAGTVEID